MPQSLEIPERLVYDVARYIKASFDSTQWHSVGDDLIIESTPTPSTEKTAVQVFYGAIDSGISNLRRGKLEMGKLYLRKAFHETEILVGGQYHDIIPNLFQKITDLHTSGFVGVAVLLQRHIAKLVTTRSTLNPAQTAILRTLTELDLSQIALMEEKVMAVFADLFLACIGNLEYNTFVMQNNLARRRLSRGGNLEDCLPALPRLDATFSSYDLRPMETLLLRIETLYNRKEYRELQKWALQLIQRAERIKEMGGDNWRRLYFHVYAAYYFAMSHYRQEHYAEAMASLPRAAELLDDFEQMDVADTRIFWPEKAEIVECMEDLGRRLAQHEIVAIAESERMQIVERMTVPTGDEVVDAEIEKLSGLRLE
jgi:hypothetical protein